MPWQNAFTNTLNNWLHVFLFTSITVLLRVSFPNLSLIYVLVAASALALATEAAQLVTGGSPSFIDLGKDLLGILIAAPIYQLLTRIRLIAVVTTSLIVTLAYPSIILASYQARESRFPMLYTSSAWDRALISDSNSAVRITDEGMTHIVWADTTWPGFHLNETVSDWRSYQSIVAEVVNPGHPQPLTIAVRHRGKRGTAAFVQNQLEMGENTIRVDLSELVVKPDGDQAEIVHVILHTNRKYAGREIYINRVYLD